MGVRIVMQTFRELCLRLAAAIAVLTIVVGPPLADRANGGPSVPGLGRVA